MTKQDLAQQFGAFVKEHGVEEASKVISRMLLGIAHATKANEIEFTDDMGRVLVTPKSIDPAQLN